MTQQNTTSKAQVLGNEQLKRIRAKIRNTREMMDTLNRCGLDTEANQLRKTINKLENEFKLLKEKLTEDKNEIVRSLFLCLAACDIATMCADEFASKLHKGTQGYYAPNNSLAEMVREQAASFNKIVQIIDESVNEYHALQYADMAEEICEQVVPMMRETIRKWSIKKKLI